MHSVKPLEKENQRKIYIHVSRFSPAYSRFYARVVSQQAAERGPDTDIEHIVDIRSIRVSFLFFFSRDTGIRADFLRRRRAPANVSES